MNKEENHNSITKQTNKKLIRNLIRDNPMISKMELTKKSKLTFPTVSQSVTELLKEKEVLESMGQSSGGRPGNVYELNPSYLTFFCGMFLKERLVIHIFDYCGKSVETKEHSFDEKFGCEQLEAIFSSLKQRYSTLSMGILGIPGISVDGEIKHYPYLKRLESVNISKHLKDRLNLTVLLENDINSIAMGESKQFKEFAHIIWINGCIGSAIVIDGKVRSGYHGCAGEVEYVCSSLDNRFKSLKESMMAICSVVDVPIIAFSGDEVEEDDIEKLNQHIEATFEEFRRPKLELVRNENSLYLEGLLQIMKNELELL